MSSTAGGGAKKLSFTIKRASAPAPAGSVTNGGGGGDAGGQAGGAAEDPLDVFYKSIEAEAGVPVPKLSVASVMKPTVITLDELLHTPTHTQAHTHAQAAAPAGQGGADAASEKTPPGAVAGDAAAARAAGAPTRSDEVEMDDEAYHRAFVESLRAAAQTQARADEAAPAGAEGATPASAGAQKPAGTAAPPASAARGLAGLLAATTKRGGAIGTAAARSAATAGAETAGPAGEDMNDAIVYDDPDDEEAKLYKGAEWEGPTLSALEVLQEKLSKKDLKPVDHSKMSYAPFRKSFYVEAKEISDMKPAEVAEIREDLEIKLRGKNVPRPVTTWEQCGLPDRVLDTLVQRGFQAPFAIQRQALPAIMSGRDVIGVARTGSGKTLAYLLPMLRHILDQPPLVEGDGPIALVLAPSRELVTQIYNEARKFAKPLGLNVAPIYGGASVGEQIAQLKRGSEIVVATPGRLIDILTMQAGRVISLARVSYVVLDEADRMFDLGFEPQIARIVGNTRPDRQTVMFSATFPPHVEGLAKKVLSNPVDIVVGGRSMASSDVTQWVEIHDEADKFPRLLQLLGHWYELGSILVFVDTKEHCDMLYTDLMKLGYPSLSLHGGKDQIDRDQTLIDFKNKVATIMIATSVAGRGLDVKDLVLVVNYSCPNHLEDYVHRVGRTGRAGRKGTAFTFITPQEGMFAADMIRALKDAKQADHVSPQLQQLADEYAKKVAAGEAKKHLSGYATRGFKFDDSELSATQSAKEIQKRAYELEAGIKDIDAILAERQLEEEEAEERQGGADESAQRGGAAPAPEAGAAAGAAAATAAPSGPEALQLALHRAQVAGARAALAAGAGSQAELDAALQALAQAEAAAARLRAGGSAADAARTAATFAERFIREQSAAAGIVMPEAPKHFHDELEVNDYPPVARSRALRRENLSIVQERNNVATTTKGIYVAPGKKAPPNERKLYLLIEGTSEESVRQARSELRRLLEEETLRMGASLDRGGGRPGAGYGKFVV